METGGGRLTLALSPSRCRAECPGSGEMWPQPAAVLDRSKGLTGIAIYGV